MLKQQIADLLAVQQEQRAAAAAAAAAVAPVPGGAEASAGAGLLQATAAAMTAAATTTGALTGLTHAQMEAVAARKAAVRTFLAYRTSGIKSADKWRDLVTEDFVFVSPVTTFLDGIADEGEKAVAADAADPMAAIAAAAAIAKRNDDEAGAAVTRGVADLARDVAMIDALTERIRRHAQQRWRERRANEAPRRHVVPSAPALLQPLAASAAAPGLAVGHPLPALAQLLSSASIPAAPAVEASIPAAPAASDAAAYGTVARALKVVQLEYVIDDPSDIVVDVGAADREACDARAAMCHWRLATRGLVDAGYSSELTVDGMMRARFEPSDGHKLSSVELVFDAESLRQQLEERGLFTAPPGEARDEKASAKASTLREHLAASGGDAPAAPAAAHAPLPEVAVRVEASAAAAAVPKAESGEAWTKRVDDPTLALLALCASSTGIPQSELQTQALAASVASANDAVPARAPSPHAPLTVVAQAPMISHLAREQAPAPMDTAAN